MTSLLHPRFAEHGEVARICAYIYRFLDPNQRYPFLSDLHLDLEPQEGVEIVEAITAALDLGLIAITMESSEPRPVQSHYLTRDGVRAAAGYLNDRTPLKLLDDCRDVRDVVVARLQSERPADVHVDTESLVHALKWKKFRATKALSLVCARPSVRTGATTPDGRPTRRAQPEYQPRSGLLRTQVFSAGFVRMPFSYGPDYECSPKAAGDVEHETSLTTDASFPDHAYASILEHFLAPAEAKRWSKDFGPIYAAAINQKAIWMTKADFKRKLQEAHGAQNVQEPLRQIREHLLDRYRVEWDAKGFPVRRDQPEE